MSNTSVEALVVFERGVNRDLSVERLLCKVQYILVSLGLESQKCAEKAGGCILERGSSVSV